MANVLLGEDNSYKIYNFGNVTTHRVSTREESASMENEIKRHTTEGYRAPEQLFLHSGYSINEKVDVFCCGVILFVLSFHRRPFDTEISTLNTTLATPDFPKYSGNLIKLL